MTHSLLCSTPNRRKNGISLWLLWFLLWLSASTALAQSPTTLLTAARVTPAGPLNLCSSTPQTLIATAVYPEFNVGTGFNDSSIGVRAIAVQSNGKVLVGGHFSTYNGVTHNHIVRLNTDGSLDSTLRTGTGFNDNVIAMAVLPDDKVLVGGFFTRYNNTPCSRIARLNPDGSLDPTFNAGSIIDNGGVLTLAVQSDGKILVGGFFNTTDGTSPNRIARLNTNGSLDPTFNVGTGFNFGVRALALQPDGHVLVGGFFTRYNGDTCNYIARLNTFGSLDTTFSASSRRGRGFDTSVYGLALQPDGKVLAGGTFTTYDNVPRSRIARLNPNGSLDNTFQVGTGLGNVGAGTDPGVYDLEVQPDGKVLIGGEFTSYNGAPRNRIARLNDNGSLDPIFNVGTGFSNAGVNAGVYAITIQPDNRVLVGGSFTNYSSTPRNRIARLNDNGSLNTTATPIPTTTSITYAWLKDNVQVVGSASNTFSVTSPGEYSVRMTIGGSVVSSNIVKVNPPPGLTTTSPTPAFGGAGTTITLNGTNLESIKRVLFKSESAGNCTAAFVLLSPTQIRVTVPDSAATGPLTLVNLCGTSSVGVATFRVLPVITGFSPQTGTANTIVTLSGTGFTPGAPMAVRFSGVSTPVIATVASARQLTAIVPIGATTGRLTLTTTTDMVTSADDFVVPSTGASNLLVNDTRPLPAGTYGSITVIKPGVLTLSGNATVTGQLSVQDGATLHTGTSLVLGTGSFALAAGATLSTSNAEGITTSGATGAVQTSTRSFSSNATYSYTGTLVQVTGTGLPSQVRALTTSNPISLTLTNPVSIAQTLTLASAGNLLLNNNALTLLSDASGTALVVNSGTGTVVGQATVQRYINPVANRATGFRYYGTPVRGATANVLAPAAVYDYDQNRSATQRDTLPLITYGFSPQPIPVNSRLTKGRGYAAAIPAATTVNFVGTLNNGDTTLVLARNNSSYAYYAGWHLVSNPYPSPLDWDKVAAADRAGLEAAIYVYESTGPGKGYYRSYVNGAGTASPIIAAGQAFFVRVKKGNTSGTLTFRNTQRVVDYAIQADFNRIAKAREQSGVTARPKGNGCNSFGCRGLGTTAATQESSVNFSWVTVYSDATASSIPVAEAGFNSEYDAEAGDLQARSNVALSIANKDNQELSVKGVNDMATAVFPLTLKANAPGRYILGPDSVMLNSLPLNLSPYLYDKVANRVVHLRDSVFSVNLTPIDVLNPILDRFELRFSLPLLGTNAPWSPTGNVEVYPNPASEQVKVWVPAVAGAPRVQVTLLNSLGQVVRQQDATLPAAGTTLQLDLNNLAGGVYILRLQAGTAHVTRRIMVQH
ncbi:T9SS type A sorting domain-containing protein [uncultured Hymenobacter sp.]|uniref:T9SS type A sorting domain-containing protein n=1 Tax=uncultured Hymenobacter sp. TaxID=170016 RepID=UPI0035CB8EFC